MNSAQDEDIISHARRNLLFSEDSELVKSNDRESVFNVSMGSYDGVEICNPVGLFLLDDLRATIPNLYFGIYKDDTLGLNINTNRPTKDRFRTDLIQIMETIYFEIYQGIVSQGIFISFYTQ